MVRDLLPHLPVIVAVAKARSFSAAAGALNMSPSAVSHAVRTVEERVGEVLFTRTTRSVALTGAGAAFVTRISAALEDIAGAFENLSAERGELTGTLKVNASRVAFVMALTRILAKMALVHPRLTVEVHANDALVDIVAQGFDAGVRLGESIDQDMVAVRLTPPFKSILVASPGYLQQRGRPAAVADLSKHNCINFRLLAAGSIYEWDLIEAGRQVAVRTSGTVTITDATLARNLALAGVGIAYIFEPQVREDIEAGQLEWLLPDAALQEDGLFLYYPRQVSMSPKLRAFIEVARECAGA
jgi:DNA-binding transcriptional LysR family regulator